MFGKKVKKQITEMLRKAFTENAKKGKMGKLQAKNG